MKSRFKKFFENVSKPVQIKRGSIICAILAVTLVIFPFSKIPTRYLDAVEELLLCAGIVGLFAAIGGIVYHLFISISTNDSPDTNVPLWKHFTFWIVCVCVVVALVFAKSGL